MFSNGDDFVTSDRKWFPSLSKSQSPYPLLEGPSYGPYDSDKALVLWLTEPPFSLTPTPLFTDISRHLSPLSQQHVNIAVETTPDGSSVYVRSNSPVNVSVAQRRKIKKESTDTVLIHDDTVSALNKLTLAASNPEAGDLPHILLYDLNRNLRKNNPPNASHIDDFNMERELNLTRQPDATLVLRSVLDHIVSGFEVLSDDERFWIGTCGWTGRNQAPIILRPVRLVTGRYALSENRLWTRIPNAQRIVESNNCEQCNKFLVGVIPTYQHTETFVRRVDGSQNLSPDQIHPARSVQSVYPLSFNNEDVRSYLHFDASQSLATSIQVEPRKNYTLHYFDSGEHTVEPVSWGDADRTLEWLVRSLRDSNFTVHRFRWCYSFSHLLLRRPLRFALSDRRYVYIRSRSGRSTLFDLTNMEHIGYVFFKSAVYPWYDPEDSCAARFTGFTFAISDPYDLQHFYTHLREQHSAFPPLANLYRISRRSIRINSRDTKMLRLFPLYVETDPTGWRSKNLILSLNGSADRPIDRSLVFVDLLTRLIVIAVVDDDEETPLTFKPTSLPAGLWTCDEIFCDLSTGLFPSEPLHPLYDGVIDSDI